jgi:hypothetical protein
MFGEVYAQTHLWLVLILVLIYYKCRTTQWPVPVLNV